MWHSHDDATPSSFYLELEGRGRGIIMGVSHLLLLGPFYTIQTIPWANNLHPSLCISRYENGQLLELTHEIRLYLYVILPKKFDVIRLESGQKYPKLSLVIYGWSLIRVQERHKPPNNANVMSFKHNYVYVCKFYSTFCYSKNILARWRFIFLSWAENSDILNFVEKKSMYILNIQGL